MASSSITNRGNPPLVAGENLSPSRFIKLSTSANQTALMCGNAERAFGITHDGQVTPPDLIAAIGGSADTPYAALSGMPFEYFATSQYALLECGTAWTRAALLTSDASGKGKTASSTNPVNAQALTSASAGEKRIVWIKDGWAAP